MWEHLSELTNMFFIAIGLSLVLVYLSFKLTFWKRQNLPNVLSHSHSSMLGQSYAVDEKALKSYGKVFGTYDLLTPVLVITKPELINQVLVENSDCFSVRNICTRAENLFKNCLFFSKTKHFESQRNVIQKTFSINKNLIELSKHYMKSDSELIGMLSQILTIEPLVDFQAFASMYSMRKYLSSSFGTTLDQKIKTKLYSYFQQIIQNELISKKPRYLPQILSSSNEKELWKAFTQIIEEVYDNRKVDDCKNSLLFMLSDANDSNVLNKKEIIENSLMFCLMGYKTSLMTISHVIYNLAINQSIQQKLIKEIDKYVESQKNSRKMTDFKCSVKASRNGQNKDNVANDVKAEDIAEEATEEVTEEAAKNVVEEVVEEVDEETMEKDRQEFLDSINDLEYLDACIKESLRLNPPVPQLRRTTTKATTLGDIFVPKNCRIIIPVFDVHRDSDHYSEPTKFKPDRFLPKDSSKIKAGAYMPFGEGLRNCGGITPALLEMKLSLINILNNFRFVKCSHTKELTYNRNNGLFGRLIPNEVFVKLVKRNKDVLD